MEKKSIAIVVLSCLLAVSVTAGTLLTLNFYLDAKMYKEKTDTLSVGDTAHGTNKERTVAVNNDVYHYDCDCNGLYIGALNIEDRKPAFYIEKVITESQALLEGFTPCPTCCFE